MDWLLGDPCCHHGNTQYSTGLSLPHCDLRIIEKKLEINSNKLGWVVGATIMDWLLRASCCCYGNTQYSSGLSPENYR